MPRSARQVREGSLLLEAILASPPEDRESYHLNVERLQALREQSKDESARMDLSLLGEIQRLREAFTAAQHNRKELKELLDKLMSPPLHPAVFLGHLNVGGAPVALVSHGNARRVVILSEQVADEDLQVGDEVLLSNELNVLVERTPQAPLQCGQTAFFDRFLDAGRVVLKWRDEEVVAAAGRSLVGQELKKGDEIRWDENAWVAFEKLETGKAEQFFLEEIPSESFDDVGGLDREIEELKNIFLLHSLYPEFTIKYKLQRKRAVMLEGPPGNGKTMMARALANWLGSQSVSGRARFMNVKPGSLGSMWYSRAEKNIRDVFRMAREAGEQEPDTPVVLFMDEIDSLGMTRGEFNGRVDDKVLDAFMVELNGLEDRGNVLVITATNRKNDLDPALLRIGRLGDASIVVPRPNRNAAAAILGKYLSEDLPYHHNGSAPSAVRSELIDAAVSRLYSPNGEGEVASLTFRDGTKRVVRIGELMTGVALAQIATDAGESACRREIRGGEEGIRLSDLLGCIDKQLAESARLLTPRNCRNYLSDLPQDADIVRVDPVSRKATTAHRYLKVA